MRLGFQEKTALTRWAWLKNAAGNQSKRNGILGNSLATTQAHPAPTPQIAKSLSPQGLQDHRAAIAFEVKTHVKFYERDDRVVAAKIAWWCDELQDWTQEQVVWALREWNRESPRVDPSPGDILGLMKAMRGKREAEKMASLPKPPEPEHRRVTAEEATAILAEVGIANRFKTNRGTGEGQA